MTFRPLPPYIMASMDKLFIEALPETKDIDGAKHWSADNGYFAQICYREEARHIAYFTIKAGFSRGMHYHEKKDETFYVISGRLRASFIDLDSGEKFDQVLTPGMRLRVRPRCWHAFYGLEDSSVVEYSPQEYDKEDAYRMEADGV